MAVSYSLTTIWYERNRFLPAILAVAFSALLIALQCGIVLGLLSMMSLPVDQAAADVWVGYPGVRSVDLGRPIPERWFARLAAQPEIERVEPAIIGFGLWIRPSTSQSRISPEACTVVGTRLDPGSLGAPETLRKRPDLLARLAEPRAIAIDASELGRLGVQGIGDQAEVMGHRVQVVGLVHGCKSLGGPYVFCSLETARVLLHYRSEEATYLLGKCRDHADAAAVVARLRGMPRMDSFTDDEFSRRSRLHWLLTTKAGIAVGFTALLGLLVGAVVTSQTLYAATAAAQREYATLRAMGIPRWRLKAVVLAQSFWVGLAGIVLSAPITFMLAEVANALGTQVRLPPAILIGAVVVTLSMALLAGLAALRSFQRVDPVQNIR